MKRALCVAAALLLALLTACSGGAPSQGKEVDLKAVMTSLGMDEGMMELDENDLMDLYGIEASDVKQFAAKIPTESLLADEIVLIEAVDAQAAARIKKKLDSRYQSKLNENKDYLPEEYDKVSKCKVVAGGNFVALIIAANGEDLMKIYEAALK